MAGSYLQVHRSSQQAKKCRVSPGAIPAHARAKTCTKAKRDGAKKSAAVLCSTGQPNGSSSIQGSFAWLAAKKISELKAPCVMKVGFKTNLGVQPRHLTPKCKMQARVKSVSTPIQIAFKTSVLLRATKLATPNLISNAHTCEASESKPKATHRVHAQTNATVCGCLRCRLLLEAHTICLDPGPWTFG